MKRIFFILLVAGCLAVAGALSGCSKPKIIPNERLARIFHDIYLVDAYAGRSSASLAALDSLNIYEPVLAEYGYTSEDLRYTLGSFSKRKSARLSEDVVQRAVEMLRAESGAYDHRLAVVDTLSRRAGQRFKREVLFTRSIRVRSVGDTSRLRLVLPTVPGRYEVSFRYMIDSIEANDNLRTNIHLEDGRGRSLGSNSRRLIRNERSSEVIVLEADTTARRLVLDLNPYPRRDLLTPLSLRIDSLRVVYFLPDRVALDSLFRLTIYETPLFTPSADSLGS